MQALHKTEPSPHDRKTRGGGQKPKPQNKTANQVEKPASTPHAALTEEEVNLVSTKVSGVACEQKHRTQSQ